jgi:hypothetical protein
VSGTGAECGYVLESWHANLRLSPRCLRTVDYSLASHRYFAVQREHSVEISRVGSAPGGTLQSKIMSKKPPLKNLLEPRRGRGRPPLDIPTARVNLVLEVATVEHLRRIARAEDRPICGVARRLLLSALGSYDQHDSCAA